MLKELKDAIASSEEQKGVGRNERKGDTKAANGGQGVMDGVIVEDESGAVASKG